MLITKVVVVAVCSCLLTVILNQYKPEFSLVIRLATVLVVAGMLFKPLTEISADISVLSSDIKLNSKYIYLLLKALFIGITCKVVCDICNDTGNKAISTCVELAGQVAIMLLAIPLITALAGFAKEFLNQ